MQDGIIKGTGNSRYLKSISNFLQQYPTYQDFVAALVAGTLPIDLNGINETGWDQLGTALNKANLLSDETLTGAGLPTTTVPDDIFAQSAKIQIVTYIGTGTYGEDNPNKVNLRFKPNLVILGDTGDKGPSGGRLGYTAVFTTNETTNSKGNSVSYPASTKPDSLNFSFDGTELSFWAGAPDHQFNISGVAYTLIALF